MEINEIGDIIITGKPFTEGSGWEAEISSVIKAYSIHFYGTEPISATTLDEVEACEKRLGTILPEDLKLFYLEFGPARLTERLLNVSDFYYLSASWDDSYLNLYSKEEQEIINGLIVFGEYLGNGNLWCFQKDTKHIFYFNHDTVPNINGMFDNFYEYMHLLLLYTQAEMGQEIEGLEEAIEKLVIDKIGIDRVRVWQYITG